MKQDKGHKTGRAFRLEELERKNIHSTPEDYFEKLPQMIQARIKKEETPSFRPILVTSLKFAIPAIILVAAFFWQREYFGSQGDSQDPIALIDEVSSQDLIAYLDNSDITTEEILEEIDANGWQLDFSDENNFWLDEPDFSTEEINQILEEYDIERDYL